MRAPQPAPANRLRQLPGALVGCRVVIHFLPLDPALFAHYYPALPRRRVAPRASSGMPETDRERECWCPFLT